MKFPSYSVFFGKTFLKCASSSKYFETNVFLSLRMLFSYDFVELRELRELQAPTWGKYIGFEVECAKTVSSGMLLIDSSLD